jgi:CheY-like chemotaxis protein
MCFNVQTHLFSRNDTALMFTATSSDSAVALDADLQECLQRSARKQAGKVPRATPEKLDVGCCDLRVLVAEDNPVLRSVTTGLLATWGITPALAADGFEAVLLAAGGVYDIILMDLDMPGMGGLEAVYLIRNEERDRLSLERMTIVAYTSDADVDEAVLRACGFDALLKKPCSGPALEACLLHWCPSLFAPQPG